MHLGPAKWRFMTCVEILTPVKIRFDTNIMAFYSVKTNKDLQKKTHFSTFKISARVNTIF